MKRALTVGCLLLVAAACGDKSTGSNNNANNSNNANNANNSNNTASGACSATNATATTAVSMSGTSFTPNCIKVAKGTQVVFTNADSVGHTVTGLTTDTFDSGQVSGGSTYNHTFGTTGTVDIRCDYHASFGMTMTVIVQ